MNHSSERLPANRELGTLVGRLEETLVENSARRRLGRPILRGYGHRRSLPVQRVSRHHAIRVMTGASVFRSRRRRCFPIAVQGARLLRRASPGRLRGARSQPAAAEMGDNAIAPDAQGSCRFRSGPSRGNLVQVSSDHGHIPRPTKCSARESLVGGLKLWRQAVSARRLEPVRVGVRR